jgi:sugar lactone lactonase YvrE
VAGENGGGIEVNQLSDPTGLYVDDNQTIYVADHSNHRIMEWKRGATSGQVVVGGKGQENGTYQLDTPFDLIVDKERNSLIITDNGNNRVVRWFRRNGTTGETVISNIRCRGLAIDENGSLYVVDGAKDEVRRYRMGDTEGIVMAGGNGQGSRLDQFYNPSHVFVDQNHSVYVSDSGNHRVMKWEEGAKEGILVAGGLGEGDSLSRLVGPRGIVVDQLGTVYVADYGNHRIMRWPKGDTHGSVIAGGNGQGAQSNQLYHPYGLSFDRHGNLYIADTYNHRIQKFYIE